jgi:hypothetical protein
MNILRRSVAYRCLGAAALLVLSASCNHDATAATQDESAPLVYAHPKPSIFLVHGAQSVH